MLDIEKKKTLVVWGTGSSASDFFYAYQDIDIDFFVETEPTKSTFKNLKVAKASKVNWSKVNVIVASEFTEEIYLYLLKQGCDSENIFNSNELILRDSDASVVSYQKCGRTWLRMMIGYFLHKRFNLPESDILKVTQSAPRYKKTIPLMPRLMFTHDDNAHRKTATELSDNKDIYHGKKVIFLSRDPRDVVISNYYHMTFRISSNHLGLDDFIRKFFSGIIRFYNIWADYGFNEKRILIRYEDLHFSTAEQLMSILNFIDVNICPDPEEIELSVKYASFDNMKKYEVGDRFNESILKNNGDHRSAKVRKGKVGGFKDIMSNDLQKYCMLEMKHLNSIFLYS